ncbi:MAG: hypothetical protein ACTSUD_00950 [Alphaproteobacteria bacterium]
MFTGVALGVILPVVAVGVGGIGAPGGSFNVGGTKIVLALANYAILAIILFAFYATKGYFTALSYRRANLPIYIIIAVQIVWAVLGLMLTISGGYADLAQSGNAVTAIFSVVVLVNALVFAVSLLIFAIFSIGFGRLGGGIWKAVGILYLLALGGYLAGFLLIGLRIGAAGGGDLRAISSGMATGGAALILIGFLCYAAAIICHGIGLIMGAGRLENMPSPADAF